MLFSLFVIVDAYKDDLSVILSDLTLIFFPMNLVNGSIGRLVILQFYQYGGFVHVFTGHQHQVGKAFTSWQLSMERVVVFSMM